jgi:hypothetical protein
MRSAACTPQLVRFNRGSDASPDRDARQVACTAVAAPSSSLSSAQLQLSGGKLLLDTTAVIEGLPPSVIQNPSLPVPANTVVLGVRSLQGRTGQLDMQLGQVRSLIFFSNQSAAFLSLSLSPLMNLFFLPPHLTSLPGSAAAQRHTPAGLRPLQALVDDAGVVHQRRSAAPRDPVPAGRAGRWWLCAAAASD